MYKVKNLLFIFYDAKFKSYLDKELFSCENR